MEQVVLEHNGGIVLTQEQRASILGLINSNPTNIPSIRELTNSIFPDMGLDGRSNEAKVIKEYLATLNIKTKSSFDPKYTKVIVLTEEQKLYIRNNAQTMTISEMARALFNKESICKINLEYKAVQEFMVANNIKSFEINKQSNVNGERFIPKTLDQAARRVNKYVLDGIDIKNLKKDTRLQNCLQTLIKYCHSPRYGLLMTTFTDGTDIDLFESSFIRYVWDKPDLTEEEVDTYLNLCCDIVNHTKMQREVERLGEMRDQCLDDSEGRRLSMGLVTAMGELYKEMDNNQKRQNAALKNLIGTRNERLDGQRLKASFTQIVDAWREKQKRDRLIALAERRKQVGRDEIDRLDSLDAIKVEIFGLNRESYQ